MTFIIEPGCQIHKTATINVSHGVLGSGSIIGANVTIEGTRIQIGRESFIDAGAHIGGGSCFDSVAFLTAGDWLHMGRNSHINIARGVTIGNEFGCGIETKIFTHGAYLDAYNLGAPVQWGEVKIGNNVWMPNAWVNPGVDIGDNVVISARSLVNISLPSGVLAGGIPAKILKNNYMPRVLSASEKKYLISQIIDQFSFRVPSESVNYQIEFLEYKDTVELKTSEYCATFDLKHKTLEGPATELVINLKDQFRRNGIRFPYSRNEGEWVHW